MSKQHSVKHDADVTRRIAIELADFRSDLRTVSDWFKDHISRVSLTSTPGEQLDALIAMYSSASITERDAILDRAVDRIGALAVAARVTPGGTEAAVLDVLGNAATTLVLNGALHQQVVCTVAARLARHPPVASHPLPHDFRESVVNALITVLRVGAPTTRDSAVEALGGLLKHTKDEDRERMFPAATVPERSADPQQRAERQYFETLNRRRMMALAIAGHPDFLNDFKTSLATPVAEMLTNIRTDANRTDLAERLADGLNVRADLLRTLTAMLRQQTNNIDVAEAIEFLLDGARLRRVSCRDLNDAGSTQVLIALSRFQESVFSTISVMVRRGFDAPKFDVDVAAALNAIPRTVVGSAELCNANVRATIATIGAAARLLGRPGAAETRKALLPLFESLKNETRSLWLNLGISEGCLRVLPYLLSDSANKDLTTAALDALFSHLHHTHDYEDLFETHRQLIAGECFRHILLRLGAVWNDATEPIETVLLHADTQHVISAFQADPAAHSAVRHDIPQYSVDDAVISGIAFETDVLKRSAFVFAGWKEYTAAQRAVLTRILAAQLRASSRDIQDLARHTVLRRRYAHLPTVSLRDEDRMHYVWTLLAALPAEAAGAADADLQDFINHCGRRNRASAREPHHTEDLPGHILAMISDAPSSTIAEAIAREIDLNRQHERKTRGSAYDFARALYHVTLRDPDTSVFDHLLPRTTDKDRTLVALFRKHVETVKMSCVRSNAQPAADAHPINFLAEHAVATIADIENSNSNSATLQRLKEALEIFRDLAANTEDVWKTLVGERDGGGVRRLLVRFDEVPHDAEIDGETAATIRVRLAETHKDLAARIQRAVSQYLDLPVGDFKARSTALRAASDAAKKLHEALERHEKLQPPERVMLVTAMAHLRSLFERTSSWWCDEPQRRRYAGDESNFWFLFTRTWEEIDRHNQSLHAPVFPATETERRQKEYEMNLLEPLKASFRLQPPPYKGQDARFERYYVEWMEAELRIDAIKEKLEERWSSVFRVAYWLMTNRIGVTVLLTMPCVFAAASHARGDHDSEGLIFFVFGLLTIVAIPVIFIRWIRRAISRLPLLKRWFSKAQGEGKQLYRLEAILPRLARLIAVPLALIVELDHTYHFAVHASTWILLLLIMVACLPAWFFVRREIVNVDDQGVPQERTPELRARVRQVMALALAHSFAIAFLFSIVFASTALRDVNPEHTKTNPLPAASSLFMRLCNVFYGRMDAFPDPRDRHRFATFALFLPRDTPYDLGAVVQSYGFPPPLAMRPHLRFVFYPTLVITWTALALFVGMFLEGFVKGERLRVSVNKLEEGEHQK